MTTTKKTAKKVETTVSEAVEATVNSVVKAAEKATTISNGAFKGFDDVIAYNTSNLDAAVTAGNIWMKGVQDFTKAWSNFAQSAVEKNTEIATQVLACKSVEEAVSVQSDFAIASYDVAVTEGRKFTDMGTEIAEKASAPLKSRMDETVTNFSKSIAA